MSYWDDQKTRMQSHGVALRDVQINNAKEAIQNTFKESPSYYKVDVYAPSSPLASTPLDVWVVNDSKTKALKKISVYPDQNLSHGSLVYWKNDYWLTTLLDADYGDVYTKGIIEKCNIQLKWLDEDGNLQSYYCVLYSNSTSNFGLKDDRIMTLPDGRRQITMSRNNDTEGILKGKRFFIDSSVYKVTDVDRVSEEGLVNIGLQNDVINEAVDNISLRIADYYGKIAVYSIVSLDGNVISEKSGQTYQIHGKVMNNGIEDDSQTIIYTSNNRSIATVDSNGLVTTLSNGNVTIALSLLSDPSIKTNITLAVQLNNPDNYTVSIAGDNSIIEGFKKHYSIEVRNNGILDISKRVNWTLYGQDGVSSTTLGLLSNLQYTQCDVTGSKVGLIKLKCVLQGYASVTDIKAIEIKNIL